MSNFEELMHMAIREFTDIEQLLEAFFAFMCTKTDFYHTQLTEEEMRMFGLNSSVNRKGFKPGRMRKLLMQIFDRHLNIYRERFQPYLLTETQQPNSKVHLSRNSSSGIGTQSGTVQTPTKQNFTTNTQDIEPPTQSNTLDKYQNTPQTDDALVMPQSDVKTMLSTDYTLTPWNGARTDIYCWTQTFNDVTLEVVVRQQLTTKDVGINITQDAMQVYIKGLKVISGKFPQQINATESMWSIEDKHRVIISLDKCEELWWDCLILGDDKIDVTQIESVKRFSEFSAPQQNEMINLIRQHQRQ